jgi:CelD/BcsL family acetyltransferase involved in cellulose biosynthesis
VTAVAAFVTPRCDDRSPGTFLRGTTRREPDVRASQRAVRDHRLVITRIDGVRALLAHRHELDAVNAGSAQPSPFHDVAFIATYALHSEKAPGGVSPRTYVVRDGQRVIGWAALAAVRDRFGPLGATRLEFVTYNDCDRPTFVAMAGREREVADALFTYLVRVERDWSMLELRSQVPGSVFHESAHAARSATVRVRDIALDPYTEVPITWSSVGEYFASLSKRMRSNVSRQARHLFAAGNVELITAHGAQATTAMWDAFADVEQRSWKRDTKVAMSRSAQRLDFYREMAAGSAAMEPWMVGVALNGVLVACLLNGSYGERAWCVEMSFDESKAELGPGQLLLLLAIGDAIEAGKRSVNFYQLQGYFKVRWNAEEIPVVNVQLLRRTGLHETRAIAGDVARRAQAWRAARSVDGTADTVSDGDGRPDDGDTAGAGSVTSSAASPVGPPSAGPHNVIKHAVSPQRSLADTALAEAHARRLLAGALASGAPGLVVHRGAAAEALLPFPVSVTASKGKPAGKKRVAAEG